MNLTPEEIKRRMAVAQDVLDRFSSATVVDLGVMVEEIQVWVAHIYIQCKDGKRYVFNLKEPPDIQEMT